MNRSRITLQLKVGSISFLFSPVNMQMFETGVSAREVLDSPPVAQIPTILPEMQVGGTWS